MHNGTNIYQLWRECHLYYEVVLALVSLLFNGVVVYLVLTSKNKVMRSYGRIVLLSVLGDLIFAAVNFATMEVVEIKGGISFFIILGPFRNASSPYNFLMVSIFLGAIYTTVFTVGAQFVYRYFALCLRALTVKQVAVMYFVGVAAMFGIGLFSFFTFRDMTPTDSEILRGHPAYKDDLPRYMAFDASTVRSCIQMALTQSTVVVVYIVIIFTGAKINAKLQDASSGMSPATRRAHHQLNKVMIIQAVYPALVLGLPILVCTIFTQLRVDVLWAGMYLMPSISVIPIANAITVLLCIPSFRRRVVGKLPWNSSKVEVTSNSRNVSEEDKS